MCDKFMMKNKKNNIREPLEFNIKFNVHNLNKTEDKDIQFLFEIFRSALKKLEYQKNEKKAMAELFQSLQKDYKNFIDKYEEIIKKHKYIDLSDYFNHKERIFAEYITKRFLNLTGEEKIFRIISKMIDIIDGEDKL